MKEPTQEIKQPETDKIEILKSRIKNLETLVRTLEVVTGKLALANGIKVERYTNGLIVISQIEKI